MGRRRLEAKVNDGSRKCLKVIGEGR